LVAHCVARETGRPVAEVGVLRPRPPIFPVPIVALGQQAEEIASGAVTGAVQE